MAIFHVIPAGDLALEGGSWVMLDGGPAEVRQRLMARFRFFKGEWFLDTRLGIPYFENVLIKSPNLGAIGALFRRVILTTPGVVELQDFSLSFDSVARALSLGFRARATSGDVVVQPGDPDFIFDATEAA